MRRLTLSEVKGPVARALGLCDTDSRIATLVSEAQERLLNRSTKPVGSMARYRFCATDNCIVLPRQIRSIEAYSICNEPGVYFPVWHEFLGNGTFLYDEDTQPGYTAVDRGTVSTFNDIEPGKSVTSIAVTAGGSGYTSAPDVTITNDADDDTGAGATATATVAAGAVTGVTITHSGSGYTETPTVSFSGGGGSGATATATIARNRKVNVISSVAEAASSRILLQGYDENAQWVRTLDSGSWIDGEYVTIANSNNQSTTILSKLVRAIKPVTNGVVRLYSWDNTTSENRRDLAVYEPSETHPIYRRVFMGIKNSAQCSGNSGSCDEKSVTVLAKLQHVPVSQDNDFLVLGNLAAIKLMATAILREEENRYDESQHLEVKAIAELEGELASYQGDGQVISIKAEDHESYGMGVFNVI